MRQRAPDAIGGITRSNARSVIDAGADPVALVSDLVTDPRKSAEEFLRILRGLYQVSTNSGNDGGDKGARRNTSACLRLF